jgi:hypothetical protein
LLDQLREKVVDSAAAEGVASAADETCNTTDVVLENDDEEFDEDLLDEEEQQDQADAVREVGVDDTKQEKEVPPSTKEDETHQDEDEAQEDEWQTEGPWPVLMCDLGLCMLINFIMKTAR